MEYKMTPEEKEASDAYHLLGVKFPRFRGCWLTKYTNKATEEEIKEDMEHELDHILLLEAQSHFRINPDYFDLSDYTDKIYTKYSGKKKFFSDKKCHIRWNLLHGRKRKNLKYMFKKKKKEFKKYYDMINKYAGVDNILCVSARLGSLNWNGHKAYLYEKEPWYIGRIEDTFDNTYTTIFIDLNKINGVEND